MASSHDMLQELLLDDKMSIVLSLCSVMEQADTTSDPDELAVVLVHFMEANGKFVPLINRCVAQEIARTSDSTTLFRGNSLTTKMLTVYSKLVGAKYLRKVVLPSVEYILDNDPPLEVDPLRVAEGVDVAENMKNLLRVTDMFLKNILASEDDIPIGFRHICHTLATDVEHHFPGNDYMSVGGFIFLRFICPSIVTPANFGILPASRPISRSQRRALILVSKIIQNLANYISSAGKEAHMRPVEPYLEENIPVIRAFHKKLATDPPAHSDVMNHITIHSSQKGAAVWCLATHLKDNIHKVGSVLCAPKTDPKSLQRVFEDAAKSGYLRKKGEDNRIALWRKRWFIAKNDFVYYFKSPQDSSPTGVIPLANNATVSVDDFESATFSIATPYRNYQLKANTHTEMSEWIKVIERCAQHSKQADKSSAQPSGDGRTGAPLKARNDKSDDDADSESNSGGDSSTTTNNCGNNNSNALSQSAALSSQLNEISLRVPGNEGAKGVRWGSGVKRGRGEGRFIGRRGNSPLLEAAPPAGPAPASAWFPALGPRSTLSQPTSLVHLFHPALPVTPEGTGGQLATRRGGVGHWESRWAVLVGSQLSVMDKKGGREVSSLDLSNAFLCAVDDDDDGNDFSDGQSGASPDLPCCFEVCCPQGSVMFMSFNEAARTEWMDALRLAKSGGSGVAANGADGFVRGHLLVRANILSPWQQRWCLLNETAFCCYEKDAVDENSQPLLEISLEASRLRVITNSDDGKAQFELYTPETCVMLQARSKDELLLWKRSIHDAKLKLWAQPASSPTLSSASTSPTTAFKAVQHTGKTVAWKTATKSGYLMHGTPNHKRTRAFFVLHADSFARHESDVSGSLPVASLPVREMYTRMLDATDGKDVQFCFEVKPSRSGSGVWWLQGSSHEDMQAWVSSIKHAKLDYWKRRGAGDASLTSLGVISTSSSALPSQTRPLLSSPNLSLSTSALPEALPSSTSSLLPRSSSTASSFLSAASSSSSSPALVVSLDGDVDVTADKVAQAPLLSPPSGSSSLRGYLLKRGEHVKSWKRRFFVMQAHYMLYFRSDTDSMPLGEIHLENSRFRLCEPGDYGSALHFEVVSPTRIWVLQANSADEREQWYHAMKQAKAAYWKANQKSPLGVPSLQRTTSSSPVSHHFSKSQSAAPEREGYLMKQGGNRKNWKKRWFMLKAGRLFYFKSAQESEPLGIISLVEATVVAPQSKGHNVSQERHPTEFKIVTRTRVYFLRADDKIDMFDWIRAVESSKGDGEAGLPSARPLACPDSPMSTNNNNTNNASPLATAEPPISPRFGTVAGLEISAGGIDSSIWGSKIDDSVWGSKSNTDVGAAAAASSSSSCSSSPDKEGFLFKQGMQVKSWKRRWFRLRGNLLLYYKTPEWPEPAGVIPLEGCSVIISEDTLKRTHCFQINTRFRTYFLVARDQFEMAGWMEAVKQGSKGASTESLSTGEKGAVEDGMVMFHKLNLILSTMEQELAGSIPQR
eukprot:TRINITY_DN3174_c0_g1_i2.p1 TRINITY_DN3174_c0_g1~~TRINITY_DN3174_c0_g1_i2.p1  ORF type:complete len:1492 (-),score=397.22 TRINITY_DN3174_c0_g1_i2:2283-6758(-)